MKKKLYLLFVFTTFFIIACQKDGELIDRPTYTFLSITSNSNTKTFTVEMDDKVVSDNLDLGQNDYAVEVGMHQFKIKDNAKPSYFVDTLMDFQRSGNYSFSLLELDPSNDPLFLTGIDEEMEPPKKGHIKAAVINIDTTSFTKNKTITIKIYNGNKMIGTWNELAYYTMSDFIEIPANCNSYFFMEIIDAETGDIIISRDSYIAGFGPSCNGGGVNDYDNLQILGLENYGDTTSPYYGMQYLFTENRQ